MKPTTLFTILTALCVNVGQAAQVFTPGILKYEYFPGQTRQTVEAGTAGSPAINPAGTIGSNTSGNAAIFQSGVDFADNYANRFSGLFVPPTTGDYVFFVAGDDDSDLFLSTDDTPANKRLIAQEASWSNNRNWITAGFGDATLKRSDQWSPDAGATVPFAAGIHLVGGTRYYIEGVHHEGTGGDNFGATYKLVSDPDPADGDVSQLTGTVIGIFIDSDVLAKVLTSQPPSRRVLVGDTPTLDVNAVAADTRFQWYKGGTAIAGATNNSYQLPAITAGDNGAIFYVTATNSVAGVQSSNAVITVGKLVLVPGAKDEVFDGATRDDIENGSLDGTTPLYLNTMSSMETPTNQLKDGADFPFAQRVSAIFLPPVTGDYVFFLAADDDTDLFISTDATPAKKYQIAAEPGWSGVRSYLTVGGGAPVSQKRSDQWVPDPAAPPATPPFAAGIHLIAGNKYYIEGVDHEGGGGDNFAATYKLVGEPDPKNGDAPRLAGFVLDKYVNSLDGGLITITNQPQNATSIAGQKATLNIGATAGYIGDTSSASPGLGYQWQAAPTGSSTFTNVPGALGASYTTPLLKLSDNGTQFRVALLAGDATTNSSAATLTVTPDTTPPTLVSAILSSTDNTKVRVIFSEAMEAASSSLAANYTINNGITVSAAAFQADGKSVVLTVSPITKGTTNTLTVKGVLDLAGNAIAANSSITIGFQKRIYLVTADPGPLTFAGDIAVNQHLLDRGFDVELARGDDVPEDGSTALGKDLIIQSSSLASGTVEINGVGKFRALAIPAIEWEASSIDAFGFAEANSVLGTIASQTQINIVDDSHPLAAGFPKGLVTVSTPETYSVSIPVGGHIIAKPITDPTYALIYYYDTGEKGFNDFVMPARRVFFFFQDNTAAAANDNGWKLFDAAVDWSLGIQAATPPTPTNPKLTATKAGNNLTIAWSPTGGRLQSTAVLAGAATVWKDEGTTNPATVPISGSALFLRVISP
jgi:hypothetical protein